METLYEKYQEENVVIVVFVFVVVTFEQNK
jgi:hypothetical protein